MSEETTFTTTALGPRDRATAQRPEARYLRVRVSELARGDVLVDVAIPTNLVPVGLRLGAQLGVGIDAATQARLTAMAAARESGLVFEQDDAAQGERVVIWIE